MMVLLTPPWVICNFSEEVVISRIWSILTGPTLLRVPSVFKYFGWITNVFLVVSSGSSDGFCLQILIILVYNASSTIPFQSSIGAPHKEVFAISLSKNKVLGPKIPSTAWDVIYCHSKISATALVVWFNCIFSTQWIARACKAAIHLLAHLVNFVGTNLS